MSPDLTVQSTSLGFSSLLVSCVMAIGAVAMVVTTST